MMDKATEKDEITDMLQHLPYALKGMVGEVSIPMDQGLEISEAIVSGTCIGASDGSIIRSHLNISGSHGYALSEGDNQGTAITGWGVSPRSDDMSSMTSEHFGLIGLLIVTHLVCIRYKLCAEECFDALVIYVDNKAVVDRCNKKQEIMNISDYSVPEQDLWGITTELLEKMPIMVDIQWIRSHQNLNKHGDKIHGPFRKEVQMNILADDLASRGREQKDKQIPLRPTFHNTVISLSTWDDVYVTDIRKYMVDKINGRRIMEYYKMRRGWSEELVSTIDWEGVEGMLRKANPMRRITLIKMMHNWQNIGVQKGKIRDSRLRMQTDEPLTPTEEEKDCHLCQDGCGEVEGNLHYISCQAPNPLESRKKSIQSAIKKLKSLRTAEPILSIISIMLRSLSTDQQCEYDLREMKIEEGTPLSRAIRGQERIGWRAMCQGFVHKEWAAAQTEHYRKLGIKTKYYNGGRWSRMISTILSDYCLECWAKRNETIHGKKDTDSRTKKLARLRKQVKALYKRQDMIHNKRHKRIFDMPLKKRLKMGLQSTVLWVGMAEEVLRLDRETATKNTLDLWIQSR
jgi:hypothetical protein